MHEFIKLVAAVAVIGSLSGCVIAVGNDDFDDDDDGNAASQPTGDRALETKYGSHSAPADLPWLNAVDKQGKFTKVGSKIVQRFIDEPDMSWIKVAEHYRISSADRKAIDAAVAEVK